jgi:hypothetical protein
MKIWALDLGKYKTVICAYESESGAHEFQRTFTTPADLERLVQEVKPERVVIEVCSIAGWVCDLMEQLVAVGPRLAEAIVALLDQPQRFRKASQVQFGKERQQYGRNVA